MKNFLKFIFWMQFSDEDVKPSRIDSLFTSPLESEVRKEHGFNLLMVIAFAVFIAYVFVRSILKFLIINP